MLLAAKQHGLGLRIHANQLEAGPGARLAAEVGATSADHLTYLTDEDVSALVDAGVVATLVPVADLSTREPWPDARGLIDAGATVALATDCNPGTSFTTNMPIVVALAVTAMRMTPAEALWSATAAGARALERDDVGTLRPGARADLVVLDAPSYVHLAYRPGVPIVAPWSPRVPKRRSAPRILRDHVDADAQRPHVRCGAAREARVCRRRPRE